jgi:hypothetical protein
MKIPIDIKNLKHQKYNINSLRNFLLYEKDSAAINELFIKEISLNNFLGFMSQFQNIKSSSKFLYEYFELYLKNDFFEIDYKNYEGLYIFLNNDFFLNTNLSTVKLNLINEVFSNKKNVEKLKNIDLNKIKSKENYKLMKLKINSNCF